MRTGMEALMVRPIQTERVFNVVFKGLPNIVLKGCFLGMFFRVRLFGRLTRFHRRAWRTGSGNTPEK